MKQLLLRILLCSGIAMLLAVGSCCSKADCGNEYYLADIFFNNFALADIDTVVLITTSPAPDSVTTYHTFYAYMFYSTMGYDKMNVKGKMHTDWFNRVYLPSTNETFQFSDFMVKAELCDSSSMWCDSKFYTVESYKLNGVVHYGSALEISR